MLSRTLSRSRKGQEMVRRIITTIPLVRRRRMTLAMDVEELVILSRIVPTLIRVL